MARNLYVTATESKSGKSALVLGLMQLLLKDVRKAAFFRPIINEPPTPDGRDHDIDLILTHFGLGIPYEDTYAYKLSEARELINNGQHALLLESILNKYKKLEAEYDFILCEGTDFYGKNPAFEFDLNAEIAANLGAPVLLVVTATGKPLGELLGHTESILDLMKDKGLDVIGCLINRADLKADEVRKLYSALEKRQDPKDAELLIYVLPEEPSLGKPTVADVMKWVDGKVVSGEARLGNLINDYTIAAMQVGNFLSYLGEGTLVITPGDRSDIVLASLSSRLSSAYPDIGGILLTGGIELPEAVLNLLGGWMGTPVPIIAAEGSTFKIAQRVLHLYGKIEANDTRKINTALGHFDRYVAGSEIASRVINLKSDKITPKMFEYNLLERAKRNKMRIVLPEGEDERILHAADILIRREVADIIILGREDQIRGHAKSLGLDLDRAGIIDPANSPDYQRYADSYYEMRKHKGIGRDYARDMMAEGTYFGTMMVFQGDADGMVSGAAHTTAHTIRPAFEIIRTKPGVSLVSSVFLMCLRDRVLVFGDCAVVPNPNAQELSDIALSASETARAFGIEPRVAMLSYSTGSSGKGEDVDKVLEAVRITRERAPGLLLEGPIQYDAAIDPAVAHAKMPESRVAGRATVFVFPDLNAGNNTYKAVQRAADAVAIGPVLQGLNKPVNDLSRGCSVSDIVNTVAITAVQAQSLKDLGS